MRTESDSLGQIELPKDVYFGVHTQRALNNFPISDNVTHPEIIRAFLEIKQAAAQTNATSGNLDRSIAKHIVSATKLLLKQPIDSRIFPISDIQGGAGTSTNMNVNEVIANIALEQIGRARGDYQRINPNDHINMGQSTNDTYPSAGKIALIRLLTPLFESLESLVDALGNKADTFSTTYKMGRTQLQDAVPMTLGNSFHAWLKPLRRDMLRITTARDALYMLNMGGSAIGSGINVSYHYQVHIVPNLASITNLPLTQAHDLFDATSNLDSFVALSGALKSLAVNLSKMSNDLRLISSGPRSGLHEINLPAKQAGSSIMPGKVNPVIPEVVNQVAFEMIGFDATITAAAEAGQLELNAFEPIIFKSLIAGIEHLTRAMDTLRINAVDGITINKSRLSQDIDLSASFATAMAPIIGYQEAAKIAKESLRTGKSLRQIAENKGVFSEDELAHIFKVEDIVINARTPEHGLVLHAPKAKA